jgi:hypothetical protein
MIIGTVRPSAFAVLRLVTSWNLVVLGHSRARARKPHTAGATQKRRTSLGRAGSGYAPFFATSWKQRQVAGVALSLMS